MNKFITTYTVMVALLLAGPIAKDILAQKDKIAFESYGVKEGLPEEFVAHVIQDEQGFIWCATQNGLVKYDGYDFKVYQYSPDDTSSNSIQIRNLIGGLFQGADGKLWIGGTDRGVSSFDPKTEQFSHYGIDENNPSALPFGFSVLYFEDLSGNIWLNNAYLEDDTTLLCRIDPVSNLVHRYPVKVDFSFFFFKHAAQFIEISSDSSIWVLEESGNVRKWNPQENRFDLVIKNDKPLPGTTITDSLQFISPFGDQIYFSSRKGLYIWDPVEMKVMKNFAHDPENKNSLHASAILYTFKANTGHTWVMHEEGDISVIDPSLSDIKRYQYGTPPLDFGEKTESMVIMHTLQNEEGIWFLASQNDKPTSFFHYTFATSEFTGYDGRFNYKHNDLPLSNRNLFYGFIEDKTGLLWLSTRPNMYKQSPKKNQIALFRQNEKDQNSLPSDTISALFEDSKQRLWVGTENGLALREKGNNTFEVFRHDPSDSRSLSDNYIQSIFEDSTGTIWISTSNGVNAYSERNHSFSRYFYEKGKQNNVRAAPIEDHLGRIWVSVTGKGVFVLDRISRKIMKEYVLSEVESHGLNSNFITSVFQDSRNNIWMGDRRDDNEHALYLLKDSGTKFIAYKVDPNDSTAITSNEIIYITEDDNNQLWIGTDGGLFQYNYDEGSFTRFARNYIPSTASYAAVGGKFWASAYSGHGLVSIDTKTGEFEVFGEKEGLAHNDGTLYNEQIPVDDFGKLWLPNQRGLSVLDPVSQTFSNYTTKDGFQELTRFYTACRTQSGDIWIGGLHGLNQIQPDRLMQKDSIPPDVWITAVNIMDTPYERPGGDIFEKAVSFTQNIRLSYDQKDLTFEFVGLHYLRPEDNLYSWKLENYDNNWTNPSKERKASYTNLPPGIYTFKVKASNADGIWNDHGAELIIKIAPPWWQSTAAYIGYGILLIVMLIAFDRIQRKRIKEKERAQAKEKELKQAKQIKKAYDKLKTTQTQLVHAEKMASLGELTAGIAHEIQNPLNFVNNFSEVNRELIAELKDEIENENLEEVKAIAGNLEQNEEKINHHGKRADAIVKNMLQHSRGTGEEKVPTDLNALAEEYLRLSYHGLRAKDKSFNADFKAEPDPSLPKINVIPQDIGRVLLNIINNAFYAVGERSAKENNTFKPLVSVRTSNEKDHVIISVKDNGDGIPDNIREKIFQPFFTTKSTGEGTGLGLSMSFDIITKGHGGSLEVISELGSGTEMIIRLNKS